MAAINPDQLDGLTTAGVVALTSAQVGESEVLSLDDSDQLRAIGTGDIKALSPPPCAPHRPAQQPQVLRSCGR